MDNPFKSPTIISFCPGLLGLERGMERVIGQLRVATYVEIEVFIIANLVAAMEAGVLASAPIWSDAKTFPSRFFHGKIHGITGGYPCPPFSNAGKRRGAQDPRHLWPYLERHVEAIRPYWCFFENVSGHITLGFDAVYKSLKNMGYAVEAGIYSAQEVGATHRRERLFILAIADDVAYSHRGGSRQNTEQGELWTSSPQQSPGNSWIADSLKREERWPASPGSPQNEWEQPRTIKPGMGSSINGYDFRKDLLRAYGNSVVEQTAELAFRDLLNKHFNFFNK